jgi:hypothetical protein
MRAHSRLLCKLRRWFKPMLNRALVLRQGILSDLWVCVFQGPRTSICVSVSHNRPALQGHPCTHGDGTVYSRFVVFEHLATVPINLCFYALHLPYKHSSATSNHLATEWDVIDRHCKMNRP